MKKFLVLILAIMALCPLSMFANEEKANEPAVAEAAANVYYVVLGSYSSLAEARNWNYSCPDGLEGWVFAATVNGRTVYRVVLDAYYSKARAQSDVRDLKNTYGITAWIWTSNRKENCLDKYMIGLDGNRHYFRVK